jgi:hypothetical protein
MAGTAKRTQHVDRGRLDDDLLDLQLHLMDRQVVDVNGEMVCKVDDLELTDPGDGTLAVTGILVGGAALVPRLSGWLSHWLHERWLQMGVQYADRDVPSYLGLDVVAGVGSDVRLRIPRDGALHPQPPEAGTAHHRRMDDLLGMEVRRGERSLGRVIDVRARPEEGRLEVDSLVVGLGRPGSLLGYDRGSARGPWLVRSVVRHLHRHTGVVQLRHCRRIDWEGSRVEADVEPEPLVRSKEDA